MMICSRRLYKGNEYVICLPFDVSGVTSMTVNFYTDGAMLVQKFLEDFEISGGTMCVTLDDDDLDYLNDGVLRYEVIYETEGGDSGDYSTNTPYVVVTPAGYTGTTIEEVIQDAYDSGYTQGYEDGEQSGTGGYASGYTDGYSDGYESGSTDGYNTGYQSGYTDGFNYCQQLEHFFHFENITNVDGTITLKHNVIEGYQPNTLFLKYSTDGMNWVTTAITGDTTFQVPARGKLYFDGSRNITWSSAPNQWWFACDDVSGSTDTGVRYSVGGDIATLMYGQLSIATFRGLFMHMPALVYADELILSYDTVTSNAYESMFGRCVNLLTAPELPATTVDYDGYSSMFGFCESLVTAPALPATNLGVHAYYGMFRGCTSLVNAPELPVMAVPDTCYGYMFEGCTSLETAPELPATTVGWQSYYYMFKDCTSLVNAPSILPATSFTSSQSGEYSFGSSYYHMFDGCTSLVNAPRVIMGDELPRQTCNFMFSGCTSLVNAPELPATTLGIQCYAGMFAGCTSLVVAPELPATNIEGSCYYTMFSGCTSLEQAPSILPATELKRYCYGWMFLGCESLVTAPVLPAETLVDSCYNSMFYMCTSLTGVTCLANELPEYDTYSDPTTYWLEGINTSGVLFCDFALADYWSTHKPSRWILRPAAPYNQQYLTLEARTGGTFSIINSIQANRGPIYVRKNYDEWVEYWSTPGDVSTIAINVNSGDTLELRASWSTVNGINVNGPEFYAYGNMWSLIYNDELPEDGDFYNSTPGVLSYFFQNSNIVDASNLWLGGPNTAVPVRGFEYLFYGCTRLVAAPELPMISISDKAYNYMFTSCTSLVNAPELPAGWVNDRAYDSMFFNCYNLNYIKCSLYDYNQNTTNQWVYGVAAEGIFIQKPGVQWQVGMNGIPSGWTVYDYTFEVNKHMLVADYNATSMTITIKSAASWTRTSQPSWATTSIASGQPGETSVLVSIQSSTENRTGEIVFTNAKGETLEVSITQAEMPVIWVDDFPDGTNEEYGYEEPYCEEFCQDFYEHDTFDEYLDDYIADKAGMGSNKYVYFGEMEFEDEEYYVYRLINQDTDSWYIDWQSVEYGLLPKSTDLEEYRSKSLASDHTAFYPAFAHYLSGDEEEYDMTDREYPYVLVDTE